MALGFNGRSTGYRRMFKSASDYDVMNENVTKLKGKLNANQQSAPIFKPQQRTNGGFGFKASAVVLSNGMNVEDALGIVALGVEKNAEEVAESVKTSVESLIEPINKMVDNQVSKEEFEKMKADHETLLKMFAELEKKIETKK